MSKRIFIIDDEPDIIEVLAFVLAGKGYEVLSARDGREALNTLRTLVPDFILLDLEMPYVNGYEVFYHLRRDPNLYKVPVVILTACTLSDQDSERLKKMKVKGCIRKPFEIEEVLHYLEKSEAGS